MDQEELGIFNLKVILCILGISASCIVIPYALRRFVSASNNSPEPDHPEFADADSIELAGDIAE